MGALSGPAPVVGVCGRAGWPGARGVAGRGPGVRLDGPEVGPPDDETPGAGAPGVTRGEVGAVVAEAAGASTRDGAGVAGRGPGVPGRAGAAGAPALVAGRAGPGVGTDGRRVSTGLRVGVGAWRAGSLAELPLDNFSFNRRSTGGSTVDEAERTNSPMSFNIVRTVLLSTPSSFASS